MFINKTDWGGFTLYSIETGTFRLDGGAMFGVVPKTLWAKRITPDENNRIPMVMRCLLVESKSTGRRYLIDTGTGPKFDAKMRSIYQYDDSEYSMDKSLAAHGFKPEDVTDIIFTHLHFDHCGGASKWAEDGNTPVPVFENARYWVNRCHWETANNPNAREKASFLKENLRPLKDPARLNLVEDGHEWEPGLGCIVVNGHTLGQQLPLIEGNGQKMLFCADLFPMSAHVPLPWVMGYDMYPVQTLEEKDRILKLAATEDWWLFLEHDAHHQGMRLGDEGGRIVVSQVLEFGDPIVS